MGSGVGGCDSYSRKKQKVSGSVRLEIPQEGVMKIIEVMLMMINSRIVVMGGVGEWHLGGVEIIKTGKDAIIR